MAVGLKYIERCIQKQTPRIPLSHCQAWEGTESATTESGMGVVGEEEMDTSPIKSEWILNQLTSARWHLDRAAGAGNDSRRDVDVARTVFDHVARVLPNVTMDDQQRRRLQTQLSELDQRLRAMEVGASD